LIQNKQNRKNLLCLRRERTCIQLIRISTPS
jgi:hypothetical protein